MVATIEVRGAEQMRVLDKELRAAGIEGKGLRRELHAGLRAAAKPMAEAAKQAAREELPKAGGLNEWVASGPTKGEKTRWAVRNSLTGRGAGTRIRAVKKGGSKGAHDLAKLDEGIARHPTFGRRGRGQWKDTPIKAGWFSDTLQREAPAVQLALLNAFRRTAEKIARG